MRFELSKGRLQATVQTRGGELVSLRNGARTEYIWGGDPAFWSGQNPILFPIVGSLKDGRVDLSGTVCEMPRHGFARRMDFTPVERGDDFMVLELRKSGETMACYPCSFVLQVRHQLLESGFTTAFAVENTGGSPMPFCIGAHTAVRCPMYEDERFESYQLVFDRPEDAASLLLTPEGLIRRNCTEAMLTGERKLDLDYAVFRRLDTIIFQGLRSEGVALLHRETGRGIRLHFSEFPMLAFWTKPGAPFLCLEPWCGCAALDDETGRFQEKPFAVTLAPGERRTLAYSMTLVE